MQVLEKIPTNIITGFLGVGKTTALLHLLKHKPAQQRWLVVVNEFGEVAIDHIALGENQANDSSLAVKYIAGGCICCTANVPLQMTLTQAIRQIKPHRILIEPTGIAHPEALIDMLQSEFLSKVIDLRATIALVNPLQLIDDKYFDNDLYQDQITLADVLIANKIDLADDALMQKFVQWAKALFPPKVMIGGVSQGALDPQWLDIEPYPHRKILKTASPHVITPAEITTEDDSTIPLRDKPLRKENHSLGTYGCGWVFSPEEIFHKHRLLGLINHQKGFERIKGVFRIGEKQWIFLNKTGNEPLSECPIAYRKDSRLECIASQAKVWAIFEKQLLACRV